MITDVPTFSRTALLESWIRPANGGENLTADVRLLSQLFLSFSTTWISLPFKACFHAAGNDMDHVFSFHHCASVGIVGRFSTELSFWNLLSRALALSIMSVSTTHAGEHCSCLVMRLVHVACGLYGFGYNHCS